MVVDRTGDREVRLTQESLGEMLGARRSSVNLAAVGLQRAGLISNTRGCIRVENLEGLQSATCECYEIIHDLYKSLYS